MNKKIKVGIISIISIMLFIGVVYFFQQKNNSSKNLPNNISNYQKPIKIDSVNDTSNWQTYGNEEYGFEFKYPKEWGNVKAENFLEDAVDVNLEDRPKIPEIAKNHTGITFSNNQDVYIFTTKYDKKNFYEAYCYEGYCSLSNIFNLSKDIENNSNILVGNAKGSLEDEIFKPLNLFFRTYIAILPNYKIEIKFSHDGISDLDSEIITKKVFLEDLINLNQTNDEINSLDNFTKTASLFIKTFNFKNE